MKRTLYRKKLVLCYFHHLQLGVGLMSIWDPVYSSRGGLRAKRPHVVVGWP